MSRKLTAFFKPNRNKEVTSASFSANDSSVEMYGLSTPTSSSETSEQSTPAPAPLLNLENNSIDQPFHPPSTYSRNSKSSEQPFNQ